MKIESYSMQASSERVFQSVDRLRYSSATAQLPLSRAADGGSGLQPYLEAVKYSPSDQMKAIIEEARAERLKGAPDRTAQASEAASKSARQNKYEAMLSILEALMQRLTGKKFIAYRALRLTNEGASGAGLSSSGASAAASAAYPAVGTAPADSASAAGNAPVAEVTLHLGAAPARTINVTGARLEASHYEKESLSYSAQGLVRTADGRSISIDVSLNMSREFAATLDQSFVSVEKATDPLIINLSGGSASLTATKYAFDLDLDGSADQISFAGEGSGFLALDKNGDGRINDGAELFGPSSGSGFGELG
ncbi:MAG: hypothetical protein LBS32_01490, partial [Clostridiales Family XIII bacterium]|nr:hypothetical protein [Clostridiales Family XIII bacterium]